VDNRYVTGGLLGMGGFGEVHRAFDVQKLRMVALKIQDYPEGTENDGGKEKIQK